MPTLELSMIVKNGAPTLRRCLESVHTIVDRIVIGDTGSTDDTRQIALKFGADLLSIPWNNDFAQARNLVLAHATCDWILVLDADEMLDASAKSLIPTLIRQSSSQPSANGYDFTRWNYIHDLDYRCGGEQAIPNPGTLPQAADHPAYFPTRHTRLFRRHPGIYFEHCVHEHVADRMDALHLNRLHAACPIHHFGYVDDPKPERIRKDRLYHSLARQKLSTTPGSYQANLEVGMGELDHEKNPSAALPYFETARSLEPNQSTAWLYTGICLARLNRPAEALEHLNQASHLNPTSLLAHSAIGDLHFQAARYPHARDAYSTAYRLGDRAPLSQAKLGAAQVHLGQLHKGLRRIEQAISQNPALAELYEILAGCAFLAGQPVKACSAAEHLLTLKGLSGFHFFFAANIHHHSQSPTRTLSILRSGAALFPADREISTMLTQLDHPH